MNQYQYILRDEAGGGSMDAPVKSPREVWEGSSTMPVDDQLAYIYIFVLFFIVLVVILKDEGPTTPSVSRVAWWLCGKVLVLELKGCWFDSSLCLHLVC